MSDDRITAEEISQWLASEKKRAVWLAKTIGVTPATVSRWLSGKVTPSGSDESILRMLIRGEMPFDIITPKHLEGVLDFTEDQWRVITIVSGRRGLTPGKWIGEKIRDYLWSNEECRAELERIHKARREENSGFEVIDPPAMVAEEHHQGNAI